MTQKNPDLLSIAAIQKLGSDYEKKFPVSGCFGWWTYLWHNNHAYARQLKTYNEVNSSPADRWLYLANMVEKLPNTNGWLAKQIIALCRDLLPQTINTYKRSLVANRNAAFYMHVPVSSKELAENMRRAVRNHYKLQPEQQLRRIA